jgi:integral membrane protein (TIGR01906 family)
MKYVEVITRWLFILCMPVFLLTAFIAIAVNSQWVYEHSFNTYGVSQTTGIADSELEKAAQGIRSYFNSSEEYLSVTVTKDGADFVLFNEREVAHMKDVKSLIWLDYYVLLGTGAYVLLYTGVSVFRGHSERRRQLASAAVWSSSITIGLILLLGIIAVTDFSTFFTAFHLISFSNDLWLLDPNTDYLLMMFPGGFWYDCVLYLAVAIAITALAIGGVSWWYLKKAGS